MYSSSGVEIVPPKPHVPLHRLTWAGASDVGLQRTRNEDRYGAFPELGLFLVADGMGGAAGGEVAAQMAIDLVCEMFADPDVTFPGSGPPRPGGAGFLTAAIERANSRIHARAQQEQSLHGMGTTVASVLACGSHFVVAHAGDSRVYRFRDEKLELLTEDHSLFNDFVRAGLADPDRPEDFGHRNVITRAVGTEPTIQVDTRVVDARAGDLLLLCSDGLSGVVEHREIEHILRACPTLDDAAARLIAFANGRGGPDNVTVILVRNEVAGASRPARPR